MIEEKKIKFKVLRRIRKTGKICVASYMQWRKLYTANYGMFTLALVEDYKLFDKSEFVYNHKGEQLFFPKINPEKIPVISGFELKDGEQYYPPQWKTDWGMYSAMGLDCDGIPAFSHYDANYIADMSVERVDQFEPLTVGDVMKWFGWLLLKLEKAKIKTA